MHYSMLTLDKSQPGAIRNEFMTLIENEWQTISKSTWIEIVAAPTGYIVALNNDIPSEPKFIRKSNAPLIGSRVYMLNKETIQKFICYTPKGEDLLKNYDIGDRNRRTSTFYSKHRKASVLSRRRICIHRIWGRVILLYLY